MVSVNPDSSCATVMEEEDEPRSRLDDIKYYTSLFLGTVAINALFAFLFLVPFVLDPAISTMMHNFVDEPVHCKVKNLEWLPTICCMMMVHGKVTTQEINYGLTNCTWSSCREGCTAEFFKCHHIRVTYTPKIQYREEEGGQVADFEEEDWAYLDRTERPVLNYLYNTAI